jgi:hypothetical protein
MSILTALAPSFGKMPTNLSGRLRNTSLPTTSGLLPLFEAVVNSIHSIEEAKLNVEDGIIDVQILRKPKQDLMDYGDTKKKPGPDALEDIIGYKVIDNGVGFNAENMESFETLDSEHKVSKGCRGVGRLLWLKAFKSVQVESVFKEDGRLKLRKFVFSVAGIQQDTVTSIESGTSCGSIIHLDDFKQRYRDGSRKTLNAIAESILEHCLWYFVRPGGAPRIRITDGADSILLDDLYDQIMHSAASLESIRIKEINFDLIHVKMRANSQGNHLLALCADNRLVLEEKITGKIPGLYGRLSDELGDFFYACYVSSPILDEFARPERTGFDIGEDGGQFFDESTISLPDIRAAVIDRAAKHLESYLTENLKRSKEKVESFVVNRAPRYRPIMARIPENALNIAPDASDKEVDLALHKHLVEIENQLLSEGHDLMAPTNNDDANDYRKRLSEYLAKAADIKRSDLASYVSHRKVILDLLTMAIQRTSDGKYAREDLIHNLIMPMKSTSNDVLLDNCNLWLVDERLAFHDYLASDKTLNSMPITGSMETKEPDLLALNVFDNPILVSEGTKLPLASIVVVEIKRPMRNDASAGEIDDPVEQAIGYLNRVRKGEIKTPAGRPIPESHDVPGFCYVLADITPKLRDRCLIHHDLKWTHDHLGFFGYKQNCNAFIEVISFDQLVNSAKERNRAFFDKLGLPST